MARIIRNNAQLIDHNIIEAVKGGDREAFGEMVRVSIEPCLLMAMRIVAGREEAEDIVQESFLKVWEKRSLIRSPESFVPWLRKIVVNRCYDFLRREKRVRSIRIDLTQDEVIGMISSDNPDRQIAEQEAEALLTLVTAQLSPRQRIVFMLSEIEELKYDEISRITGMTRFSVKSNCHYARKKVRELLDRYDKRY